MHLSNRRLASPPQNLSVNQIKNDHDLVNANIINSRNSSASKIEVRKFLDANIKSTMLSDMKVPEHLSKTKNSQFAMTGNYVRPMHTQKNFMSD